MSGIILVGINDTAPSIAAAHWALERARSTLERVILAHVVSDADAATPHIRDQTLAFLTNQAVSLRNWAPDIQVTTELLIGSPLEQLKIAASAATLLVIGTHKTGFVQGRVFGSKYIQLAASTPSPLAVIPVTANRAGRAGIVFGVKDGTSATTALHFATNEAQRSSSTLTLVHCWTLPDIPGEGFTDHGRRELNYSVRADRILIDAKKLAQDLGPDITVRTRSLRRSPAEGLLDAAGSASVLVLGRTATGRSRGAVLGATTHDVLLNMTTATLIIPPENDHPEISEFEPADAEQVAAP